MIFCRLWKIALDTKHWQRIQIESIETECDRYRHVGAEHIDILTTYTYRYHGKLFSGKKFHYPFYLATSKERNELLDRIESKQVNEVYVNPNNPYQSVLIRGINASDIYSSIAYILIAFALFIHSTLLLSKHYCIHC